jgi:hypothetical protein
MATIVSGIIAILLLVLYAYAVVILARAPEAEPTEQVRTVLGLVGGLVSALVVAVLAITPSRGSGRSGEASGLAAMVSQAAGVSAAATEYVAWAYLFVWLACGVALLFRWMQATSPSQALKMAATSWLGLAVAAAYAYLGLHPSAPNG